MKNFIQILAVSIFILSTSQTVRAQELPSEPFLSEATSTSYIEQIKTLAESSACFDYDWKNRKPAPAGYIKGMALSFARSLCRTRHDSPSGLAEILAAADSRDIKKDAFAHYENIFDLHGISTDIPGESAVRAIYTLGIGLGMRESNGAYCEGWDVTAGANRPSSAAEAGLFQVSYDSMVFSEELRRLYQEYKSNPGRCHLQVFKQGVSCKPQNILGTGAGAEYQEFNKACPAFAAEYAMAMLRLQRSHFGPINRREAEVVPSCDSMLKSVQQVIESAPEAACRELY